MLENYKEEEESSGFGVYAPGPAGGGPRRPPPLLFRVEASALSCFLFLKNDGQSMVRLSRQQPTARAGHDRARGDSGTRVCATLQGQLAHEKQRPPRTLQWGYA